MRKLIKSTSTAGIRPMFTQGTSENIKRYQQLRKLFEEGKEYQVLAEPVAEGGDKIGWYTEFIGELTPFSKFSELEQEMIKGRLKYQVNKLYKAAVRYNKNAKGGASSLNELFDVIDSCIEVPSYDDIYVAMQSNQAKNFMIIRWGFTNDDFNAVSGLIKHLVPLRVSSINLKCLFTNKKPATNEKIVIEYSGKKLEAITDTKGIILLEDIPLLTEIHCYQNVNGEKTNIQDFKIEEQDEIIYTLGAAQTKDMHFILVDKSGNPIPGVTVHFEHDGQKMTYPSDANGNIILPNVTIGTDVKCYQNQSNIQSFHCDANRNEYRILGDMPFVEMNFAAKDAKSGVELAFVPLKFEFDGKVINKTTDGNGKVSLGEIALETKVSCAQIIDGVASNEQKYVCKRDIPEYIYNGSKLTTTGFMVVSLVDKDNKPMPNEIISVEFTGKRFRKTTDSKGHIVLENTAFDSEITCTQVIDEEYQLPYSFKFEKGKELYVMQGVTKEKSFVPVLSNITFQVVDSKKTPIPNLRVTIEAGANASNKITDADGKISYSCDANTPLKVSTEFKGKKVTKEYTPMKVTEFHQIQIGRKCLWWLWLLLLLLLLAFLLWWFWKPIFGDTFVTTRDTVKIVDTVRIKDTVKQTVTKVDTIKKEEVVIVDNKIVLNPIQFKIATAQIMPASYPDLDKVVKYLTENPTVKLNINGHTDNLGNPKQNQKLSENRAKSIVTYLEGKGISSDRLKYFGYGDTKPLFSNDTYENKEKNRRVEFEIVK